MTAESLEAAVFNAPIEVQDQILKQLTERYFKRYPQKCSMSIKDASNRAVGRLIRGPQYTPAEWAELQIRIHDETNLLTPEELIIVVKITQETYVK